MLCLSGFELYSRWVPLYKILSHFITCLIAAILNSCLFTNKMRAKDVS